MGAWSLDEPVRQDTQNQSPTWGDYGRVAVSSAQSLGAQANALGRYIAELAGNTEDADYFRTRETLSNMDVEDTLSGLSTPAKDRLTAAITSGKFWEHPFSAAALKTTGMSAQLLASLLPGGVVSGAMRGTLAVAGAGGAINTAQALDEFYKQVDAVPDAQLQEQSDVYRGLRTMYDEPEARRQFDLQLQGVKPALNFVIGAAAGAAGPAGQAVRGLKGEAAALSAGGGRLAGLGAGAAEGAIGGGIQGVAAGSTTQQALIQGGLKKDFDQDALVNAFLEPAALGGAMGAVTGAAFARPRTARPDAAGDIAKTGFNDTAAPPVRDVDVGNPDSAPTRSAKTYPKEQAEGATGVEVVDTTAPDPAQREALAAKQPEPPAAEPVPDQAMAAREPVTQEVIPQARPEPVPVHEGMAAHAEAPIEQAPIEQAPVEQPQTGRVLVSETPEAKANQRAVNQQLDRNVRAALQEEPEAQGAKHRTKAEVAQREADAETARKLFEQHVPADAAIPRTVTERAQLRDRLQQHVAAAEEAGVKIPAKVYESTPDHIVHLREAKDLVKKLNQKSFVGKKADERINSFLVRERAAKGGDFSVMRSERKAEGEMAMRRATAERADDVWAPTSDVGALRGVEAGTEKAKVKTKTGREEVVERAKAASEVRKVELTPELRAKYETPAKKPELAAPSEAQKAAGNYPKEHIKVHGLDISIETKRGQERSGTDPTGKKWSVKMPDDYGYVKRTEGADGDQVDVYVGPHRDSGHVLVIDQVDPKSKQFDEHKAMVGYRDSVEALSAYEKAFSDGSGLDRIGAAKEMSVSDFKEWLKNGDTKKPIGKIEKPASGADAAWGDQIQLQDVDVTPKDSAYTQDLLKDLHLSHLNGIPGKMAPFVRARLQEYVQNVPVHFLTQEDMGRLTGTASEQGGIPLGLHYYGVDGRSTILISDAVRDKEMFTHVLMHESVHSATVKAIEANAAHKAVIRELMDEVRVRMNEAGIDEKRVYAMTNEREFIAEAFSNSAFQEWLSRTPVSKYVAERLGLAEKRVPTMWDWFVASIRSLLGFPRGSFTTLEAIIRVGESVMTGRTGPWEGPTRSIINPKHVVPAKFVKGEVDAMFRDAGEVFKRAAENSGVKSGSPKLLKVRTMDQIAQLAERYFGGNNPVRRAADTIEMMRTTGHKILQQSEPIVAKLYELEKKYKGAVWDDFSRLVHDETMAGVFADRSLDANAHLGKDALSGMWGKAQHAQLHARWKALPEDLKQARAAAMEYFTAQQNAMSLGIIKNRILKSLGIEDNALAQRIHEGTITDADRNRVGSHTMDMIMDAKELAKTEGPYFPLMRRGDYVVRGEYKIEPPASARKLSDNEFEFDRRDDAIKWAKAQDLRPVIKSVWVDPKTGETHFPDGTKVTSKDVLGEQRFRVAVQNRHVEFFDTLAEANAAARSLADSGLKLKGVEERRFEPGDRQGDMLSYQLRTLMSSLERREGYRNMTQTQRNELVQALNEASIRFLGSTRIQSRRLPRRYVEGHSNDLTRNTWDYAQSSSSYLAKLKHQPELEAALKDMREHVTGDYTDPNTIGRSAIANEVERRVAQDNGFRPQGKFAEPVQRLLTVSFLDKLFSPAYNVINSMQPAMVTMPVLAGRFGVGRAFTELGRAYNDIAGYSVVKQGLRETARKTLAGSGTADFLADIKARIKDPGERKMLDYLTDRGSIDPESGFEIGQLVKSKEGLTGKLDTGLGYLEGIARQMPRAIEAINRTTTALAAYRLEMSRSGNHDKAVRYAQDTVNNTQGLYSNTNAAPVFNHPLAKISLQFKKFGQMIYHLLGQQIAKAYQNSSPGDRAEALKTLAMLTSTHVAMAGALGLPTEPFKFLMLGAKAAGLTSTGWDDVEDAVRETAAGYFGKKGGEIVTRGLPRAIGVDLSSRVGLDSLLSFGEPKSDKKNDVKAWAFDTLAGAPTALVGDWVSGANELAAGNFTKAAELLVPMKAASDSIRAYRQATEGKRSANGRALSEPYGLGEAATRALGFTPAREAEESSKASAFKRQSQAQSDKKSELTAAWVNAKGSERARVWAQIQTWNRSVEPNARITMNSLSSAQKRRGNDTPGVKATKSNQHILRKLEEVYQ